MKKTIISLVKGAKDTKQVRVTINKTMLIGTVGTAEFKWNIEKFDLPMVTINKEPHEDVKVRTSIGSFIEKALDQKKLSFQVIMENKDNEICSKPTTPADAPTPEKEAAPTIEKIYYVVKSEDIIKIFDDAAKVLKFIIGGKTAQTWSFDKLEEAKAYASKIKQITPEDPDKNPLPKAEEKSSASFDVNAFKAELKKEILEEIRAELKPALPIIEEEKKEVNPPEILTPSEFIETALFTTEYLNKKSFKDLQAIGHKLGLGEKNVAKKDLLIANILAVVEHIEDGFEEIEIPDEQDIIAPDFEDDKIVTNPGQIQTAMDKLKEQLSEDIGF